MVLASASYGQDADSAESIVDGLSRLAEMHEQGLLNDEEFTAAKRRFLSLSSSSSKEDPPRAESEDNRKLSESRKNQYDP